ncbi:hypothetical protein CH249_14085 [Rhodococcus sp. 05-2255-3B1]|uniref:hypothetical protein n=1 Tax=unclassified Rhodococcus (in: high G+C Gram-positive bacteria) TaxID=192944 RepID=UPI000B9B4DD8|nr:MULTISPECIES: hypothetical protein [unclassified Rhodococcus (in: high G+C Gram-positive bacteria)]OZE10209.1 hypothetical protein CH249_14085 [Rhodococcus sp. 05-2255-3B1]OZE13621.1 hypothetical protein CH250_07050 [Rhodococcus sp. 05-2255-3C]OZE13708.1 hypothetical protein CH255_23855 [Rhodococcus sp. 05-2255-2A2]
MRRYPQNWSVLRENPPVYDESTGNRIPVPPTAVPVTGLLSLRFLETKQEQHPGDLTTSQMVLQLNAPVPGGLNGRDRLRFDGDTRTDGTDATDIVEVGQVVYIRGRPKERRSAAGGPVQYVVAIVDHGSDMASNPELTP